MNQIYNTIYKMIDTIGTTQYIDLAWFWVYGNQERKKNKIINSLLEIVNNLISLEELNQMEITYDPNHRLKYNNAPVELQNTNKKVVKQL